MQSWGVAREAFADGTCRVDLDQIWKIFYDKKRTALYLSTAKTISVDTGIPLGLGPKLKNINVDFTATARGAAHYANESLVGLGHKIAARECTRASLTAHLKADLAATDANRIKFSEMMAGNSRANAEALARNQAALEVGISAAKLIRDGSIIALGVGGTVLTGGAAFAFSAGGSFLSGVAKVEDAKRPMTARQAIGTAIAAASVDLVLSVIKFRAIEGFNPGWAGRSIIAFLTDVPSNTATAMIVADPGPDGTPVSVGAHVWEETQNWAMGQAAQGLLSAPGVSDVLHGAIVPVAAALKNGSSDAAMGKFVSGALRDNATAGLAAGLPRLGNAGVTALENWRHQSPDRSPLPARVARQPVYGAAAAGVARLAAVFPDG